jgi:hypothetical protein
MRVLFTAQDLQTIRDAFGRAKPNVEYSRLYAAAVARRQADQIYNLSLTRTAKAGHGRYDGAAEGHQLSDRCQAAACGHQGAQPPGDQARRQAAAILFLVWPRPPRPACRSGLP